jgi:hypothetical protein
MKKDSSERSDFFTNETSATWKDKLLSPKTALLTGNANLYRGIFLLMLTVLSVLTQTANHPHQSDTDGRGF